MDKGRVQISTGYDHIWVSITGNTGDFIMVDSASFDPNGHVGCSGKTQMQLER